MKPNPSIQHARRCRLVCSVTALALIAGALPCTAALAAQRPSRTAANAIAWSTELDCSTCHTAEVASLEKTETPTETSAQPSPNLPAANTADATEQANPAETDSSKVVADATNPDTDPVAPQGTGHEDYAAAHVENFGLACISCHEDGDKLASAHEKATAGKTATRLKKTSVSSDLCLGCHDTENLVETTKASTILTDDNGTTVNPHDVPEGSEHGTLACTDCHKVHEQEKTLDQTAKTTCTSCHHAGVFECGTCH